MDPYNSPCIVTHITFLHILLDLISFRNGVTELVKNNDDGMFPALQVFPAEKEKKAQEEIFTSISIPVNLSQVVRYSFIRFVDSFTLLATYISASRRPVSRYSSQTLYSVLCLTVRTSQPQFASSATDNGSVTVSRLGPGPVHGKSAVLSSLSIAQSTVQSQFHASAFRLPSKITPPF